MTKKTKKKGLFAPESKRPETADMEKSAFLIGAIFASTVRLIAIFGCAVALGFVLHYVDENCAYVPKWMIHLGHYVEYAVYVLDVVGFSWSVGLHFIHYMKNEWKEFRGSHDAGEEDK